MTQEPFTNTKGEGAHNFLNPDNIRNNGQSGIILWQTGIDIGRNKEQHGKVSASTM